MVEGRDFDDKFATVIRPESVRLLVAVAVRTGRKLYQADMKSAFKHTLTDKKIWVRLPKGYDPHSTEMRPLDAPWLYALLQAGLEGIPQGPLLWFRKFAGRLLEMGFHASVNDPCVFIHPDGSILGIYVDDVIAAVPNDQRATEIFGDSPSGLGRDLIVGSWKPLKDFLRMKWDIVWLPDHRSVHISQPIHVQAVLERAGLLQCNSQPAPAHVKQSWTKQDAPTVEQRAALLAQRLTSDLYRSLVQSLNYIVVYTRPDMKFTQGKVAKYMADPGPVHWTALKHYIRYLAGTPGHGLLYSWHRANDPNQTQDDHVVHSDSSHQDCPDTSRSTLAYLEQYNLGTIAYHSRLGNSVDACINHSEMHACLLGIKQAIWTRNLIAELDPRDRPRRATPVFVDNSGVDAVMHNPVMHNTNKQLAKTLHTGREACESGQVNVVRIAGVTNPSNSLTKSLAGPAWPANRAMLGVYPSAPVVVKDDWTVQYSAT